MTLAGGVATLEGEADAVGEPLAGYQDLVADPYLDDGFELGPDGHGAERDDPRSRLELAEEEHLVDELADLLDLGARLVDEVEVPDRPGLARTVFEPLADAGITEVAERLVETRHSSVVASLRPSA